MSDTARSSGEREIFLARKEEQDRFREALRALRLHTSVMERIRARVARKEPEELPFVFLLYGEGGMGKSRLAARLGEIALHEPEFRDHFHVLRLDWEKRKYLDLGLAVRDSVSPETVFENIYFLFRDEHLDGQFAAYRKAVTDRGQAEKKVAQALSKIGGKSDRYSALRGLGVKGVSWLLRSQSPIPLSEGPTEKAVETILKAGEETLSLAREVASTLTRSALQAEEFDLFTRPNEMLARRLAEGIQTVAAVKPLVLVLDTYEIADRADPWLREVIKHAGPRVVWVLSGRDNLADSRRYGQEYFNGYRAEFPSERLRVFPLSEFSVGDVAEYFAFYTPERTSSGEDAAALHRATLGIPLAVHEAAAIWKAGRPLEDIVSNLPPRPARGKIVEMMTERFLLHCFNDPAHPEDRARLYGVALAHRPDPDLLAAILASENLESDLSDLERRYSFVFADEMKLHDVVQHFLREYLMQEVRRRSPEVRAIHERATAYLQAQREAREARAVTLEARVTDERWTVAVLGLVHHGFWLDEEQGWAALLPALLSGLVYDPSFAHALVETAEPFAVLWTERGKRQLKTLQSGMPWSADVNEMDAVLAELEASSRHWPDEGCDAERHALFALLRGRRLRRRGRYAEALAMYEEVERGLSEEGESLKQQLAAGLGDLARELMWPEGRRYAVYSAEAERILQKVVTWFPERQGAWYWLGMTFAKAGKHREAIATYQKAIELDPKYAFAYNGLGNVYYRIERPEEAVTAYKKAIELDPKFTVAHYNLGNVYSDLKRHEEAVTTYWKAIELDPKHAITYNDLGNVYYEIKRPEDAVTSYKKAIELDPKDPVSYYNLGNVYNDLKRYEEAITAYQKAVELDPEYAFVYNNLGNVYNDLKCYEEAITAYRKAIELDPKYVFAYNNIGNVYLALERSEDAIPAYQKVIELYPENAVVSMSLAVCYRNLGRDAEYTEQMEITRKMIGGEDEYSRARFESIYGNVEGALALLEAALEKAPFFRDLARHDPDLEHIRDNPRFKELVGEDEG